MFKLVVAVSMLAALCAAEPSVVEAPAAFVTATSSQYYARNYNGLVAAPVVAPASLITPAARFVAAAPVLPAPVLPGPGVIASMYAASPLLTGPGSHLAAPAPLVAAPAPYYAHSAPYVAASAPYLPRAAPYLAASASFHPEPAPLLAGPASYLAGTWQAPLVGPGPALAV